MIPTDFRQNLMQLQGGENLSTEEVQEGESLFAQLSEQEKNNPHIYSIILQGIKLLSDLGTKNIADTKFKAGFSQIKSMSEEDLKKAESHQLVAKKILGPPRLPPHLQKIHEASNLSWNEIEKTYSSQTAVVKKATEIGHGGYGTVMKVDKLANNEIPKSEVAIKIAPRKNIESVESIRKEMAFLNALHESDRLTPEEKAALLPKPVKVTYEQGFVFKTTYDGYMTKFFNGSDLFSQVNKLNMQQKIDVATQLIYQLSLISKAKGCHVDLKLENILVDLSTNPVTVKIADFGSCFFTDKVEKNTFISATPSYTMAGDYRLLSHYSELASKNPNDAAIQKELASAANQHMSRTMGFALMVLFKGTMPPFTAKKTFYSIETIDYVNKEEPLLSLSQVNKNLASVVIAMLRPGGNPIAPQEAWEQWHSSL